jgi:hypothetical protein
VILEEDARVEQNGITIQLPKGIEMNLVYRMPEGLEYYSIPIHFDYSNEPKIDYVSKKEHRTSFFYGQKDIVR